MNEIYQTAQAARVPVTSILTDLNTYGPVITASGLSLQTVIPIIGNIESKGEDVTRTFQGMAYSWANLAKDIAAPSKTTQGAVDDLQKSATKLGISLTSTANDQQALFYGVADGIVSDSDASALFGSRFAANITQIIKEGGMTATQFGQLMQGVTTNLDATGQQTITFANSIDIMKNALEIALNPLGEKMISAFTQLFPLIKTGIGLIGDITGAFGDLPMPVADVVFGIAAFAAALGPAIVIAGTLIRSIGDIVKGFGALVNAASTAVKVSSQVMGAVGDAVSGIAYGAASATQAAGGVAEGAAAVADTAATDSATVSAAAYAAAASAAATETGSMTSAMIAASAATIAEEGALDGATASNVAAALTVDDLAASNAVTALSTDVLAASEDAFAVSSVAADAAVDTGLLASLPELLPVILAVAAAIAVVVGVLVLVAAAFVAAYAYSETFRDTLGKLGSVASELGGHLSAAFGDIMSGKLNAAMDEVTKGFGDAYNELSAMDWGTIASKIETETMSGLEGLASKIEAWFNSVDWGTLGSQAIHLLYDGMMEYLKVDQEVWVAIGTALENFDWGKLGGQIMALIGDGLTDLSDLNTKFGAAIQNMLNTFDFHSWGMKVGNLLGEGIVAGLSALESFAQLLINWIEGATAGGGGSGASGAATTAGQATGKSFSDAFGSAAGGIAQGLQYQFSRISINWSVLFADAGAVAADAGELMGIELYNGIADKLKIDIPGVLTLSLPKLDDTGAMANLHADAAKAVADTPISIAPDLSNIAGFHNQILHAAGGDPSNPTPAYVQLANNDQVKLQVAAATAGPNMANVYVVNPDGTIKAPIVMSAAGPFPVNAYVVDPDGTVHQTIASNSKGPFPVGAYVVDPDGSIHEVIDANSKGPFNVNEVVVDPDGTIHQIISSSSKGPFPTGVYVLNPDGTLTQVVKQAVTGPFDATINVITSGLAAQVQAAITTGGPFNAVVNAVTEVQAAKAATGAVVGARPGGVPVIVAEANEPEVIVPWHRVGEDWNTLIPSLQRFGSGGVVMPTTAHKDWTAALGNLPKLSAGAVVGAVSGMPNLFDLIGNAFSNLTSQPSPTYQVFATIDAEAIKRDIMQSILELEQYHHLGGNYQ